MNNYQLTVLVQPNLAEKDRKDLLDGVTKMFGKVTKEDLWGNRDLAYPIVKHSKAYFAHYEFDLDPALVKELDRSLKLNEDVIRYLLIRKDK